MKFTLQEKMCGSTYVKMLIMVTLGSRSVGDF